MDFNALDAGLRRNDDTSEVPIDITTVNPDCLLHPKFTAIIPEFVTIRILGKTGWT
jgi:hypothetical protein